MTDSDKRGREIVVAIAATTVSISAVSIISSNLLSGQGQLFQQVVRFLLTIIMAIALYRRVGWVRKLSIGLLFVAGVGGLGAGFVLIGKTWAGAFLIAMGAAHLSCFYFLTFSPAVKTYFKQGPKRAA